MARDRLVNPIEIAKISTPGTNSATGFMLLYPKSDGLWYSKDGSGAETPIAQPLDSDLTAIAGLSPSNDDIIQRKSGAWTNRTLAQLITDLGLKYTQVFTGGTNNAANTYSPLDGASVYVGHHDVATTGGDPDTTLLHLNFYTSKAGTIKKARIEMYAQTAGSSENISAYIRINNTTDVLIETIGASTNVRTFQNTSLSTALSAGDKFIGKMVFPTWSTNPTSIRILVAIEVEYDAFQ